MTSAKAMDGGARRSRDGKQSPYFLQPAKGGQVAVLRRPCGNRASPKVCGIMPSRSYALALVKQLGKAESAVDDLFLEATDDGIEALEAVLEACCTSVLSRPAPQQRPAQNRAGTGTPRGNGNPRKSGRRKRGRNHGRNTGEAA